MIEPTLPNLFAAFFLGSLAGYALESLALKKPGPGRAFDDLPFLPIYGVGAALVVATAPELQKLPLPARGIAYAGGLSALEWAACHANQDLLNRKSWDYEGSCIDTPHAIAWGALGLLTEAVVR